MRDTTMSATTSAYIGPVFRCDEKGGTSVPFQGHLGLTLRDYFAAKAMQGFATDSEWKYAEHMASFAYKWADAMIKARSKA